MSQLPDSLLLAYLRGELAAPEAKLLADAARVTPELRDRIDEMRKQPLTDVAKRDGADAARSTQSDQGPSRLDPRRQSNVVFVAADRTNRPPKPQAAVRADAQTQARNQGATSAGPWPAETETTETKATRPAAIANRNWAQAALLAFTLGLGVVGGLALNRPSAEQVLIASSDIASGTASGTAQNSTHSSAPVIGLHGGYMVAEDVLASVLETAPTGLVRPLYRHGNEAVLEGNSVVATLTFTDRSGRFCREYELKLSDQHLAGIACREVRERLNGKWQVTAQITLDDPLTAGDGATESTFRPASSGAIEIIEAISSRMQAGPAVEPDHEARLIGNGWTTP